MARNNKQARASTLSEQINPKLESRLNRSKATAWILQNVQKGYRAFYDTPSTSPDTLHPATVEQILLKQWIPVCNSYVNLPRGTYSEFMSNRGVAVQAIGATKRRTDNLHLHVKAATMRQSKVKYQVIADTLGIAKSTAFEWVKLGFQWISLDRIVRQWLAKLEGLRGTLSPNGIVNRTKRKVVRWVQWFDRVGVDEDGVQVQDAEDVREARRREKAEMVLYQAEVERASRLNQEVLADLLGP